MLKTLSVKNYALIENLELNFSDGFSVFTGETGSGKSILLGALALILGKRANLKDIGANGDKCVIEGVFEIEKKMLNKFFVQSDLEFSEEVTIRRILFANGKSKAFINEEPVGLEVLKKLGSQLVDIHSQHQNLHLKEQDFQLRVIDGFAGTEKLLQDYKKEYLQHKNDLNELAVLNKKIEEEKQNLEFYTYQLEKFEQVDLENEGTRNLEKELEILNHGEEIQQKLNTSSALLQEGDHAVLRGIDLVLNDLQSLKKYLEPASALSDRLETVLVELTDCVQEIDGLASQTEFDGERLLEVQQKMSVLYQLYEVFRVSSLEELLSKKSELEQKINSISDFDESKEKLAQKIEKQRLNLEAQAQVISDKRQKVFPRLQTQVENMLRELGMEHAIFQISHTENEKLTALGKDIISFKFSANKNQAPAEIAKVASGGEISRIMLTLKSLMASATGFPTIIFDEVDTGVSGHVAEKMGHLMATMADAGQVLAITHLPQIASKATVHFRVKKVHGETSTQTIIESLSSDQRVDEVAQMLSGEVISEPAREHARVMLKGI